MVHAGAADRKFAFVRSGASKARKKFMHARNFWGRVPVRQSRFEVKQLLWLVLNIKLELARARSGSYPLSWNS